ncbi:Gag protein, partial [Globisporangium splendens]
MASIDPAQFPHISAEHRSVLTRMAQALGDQVALDVLSASPEQQIFRLEQFENFSNAQRLEGERSAQAQMQATASLIAEMLRSAAESREALERVVSVVAGAATSLSSAASAPQTPASQTPRPRAVKIDAPKFDGADGDKLIHWLLAVERCAKAQLIDSNEQMVSYAISNLRGRASEWAFSTLLADECAFDTWDIFRARITAMYQPPNNEVLLQGRFFSLKQGKLSLERYIQEMRSLCAAITTSPLPESMKVPAFLNGLNSGPARQELYRRLPATMEDAIRIALVEQQSFRVSRPDWNAGRHNCNRTLPSYAARFGLVVWHNTITVLAHVSIMATNKAVREKLARQKGEGVGTLVETLRKREEDREVASSARRTTVTADAVDVPAESDGRSAPTSDSAPAISSELRFGDLPSVKPLFARALEEEEATEEFLVVDNDGSSLEDEGALTVKLGSVDEWVEYEELQSERHAAYLHELERDPSADVSMYRTKEENDAVEAVNNRKRKHEVLITNEEAGVRAIVHDELKYSLPEMPPPELWPAGKTASNLLARARLCARDYDAQFKNWREKRLRGENGELRIHPIPVVLFVGETEEEYDADFMSCISKIKGGSTRTVSTDPTAQRSQRMQFAVDRVRLFRSKQGGGTPLRAGGRAGNRRQITRANDSPSVAPQRRQQDPGRLREDAQQAPTSSATHRTHATSQGSGCSPYAAAHAAGAQHGSGAVPACQSAGQVAPYFASASVVAPDAMVQMVHANASSLGALQQAVRTLRQQYLDETSLLKQRVTALETELKEARQMLEEYHVRGKHFHARYAPRVKTLWERHNALVSRWAASEPPDETDVLPHWDKNPQ